MTEAWTCPFCALLCDRYAVAGTSPLQLLGSDCPRANEALRHFEATPRAATPTIDGTPATLDAALEAAVLGLHAAKRPLIGGLATDVAGMRALYRLAACSGAIVDHAHGEAMQHGSRALQDRGQFTTTLAEVRERADLLVCFGTRPGQAFPEFWRRCGVGLADSPLRRIVFVGTEADDPRLAARAGAAVESIAVGDDPYTTLSWLNAIVAARPLRAAPPAALAALAQQLMSARYAVLVWEARTLDAHGALWVEALQRLVDELNRRTRAASFALGGSDGAATAQQVVTWLSGLPLRTRISRDGLEHEPVRFAVPRLLADGAVDALLWVASFGPQLEPPPTAAPRIVLGHPALAASCATAGTTFIPVSTPGIGSTGHLFRADAVVALPLPQLYADTLPSVASVAAALTERLGAFSRLREKAGDEGAPRRADHPHPSPLPQAGEGEGAA